MSTLPWLSSVLGCCVCHRFPGLHRRWLWHCVFFRPAHDAYLPVLRVMRTLLATTDCIPPTAGNQPCWRCVQVSCLLSLAFLAGTVRLFKDQKYRMNHSSANFSSVVVAHHKAPAADDDDDDDDDDDSSDDDEDVERYEVHVDRTPTVSWSAVHAWLWCYHQRACKTCSAAAQRRAAHTWRRRGAAAVLPDVNRTCAARLHGCVFCRLVCHAGGQASAR